MDQEKNGRILLWRTYKHCWTWLVHTFNKPGLQVSFKGVRCTGPNVPRNTHIHKWQNSKTFKECFSTHHVERERERKRKYERERERERERWIVFSLCRSTWTNTQSRYSIVTELKARCTHTHTHTHTRLALCLCWHGGQTHASPNARACPTHTEPENSMWRSQKDSRYTNAQTTVTHSLQQITQDSGQKPERIPPEDRRSSCERLRASRSCINQLWCLTQLTEDNRVIIQLNVDSIH